MSQLNPLVPEKQNGKEEIGTDAHDALGRGALDYRSPCRDAAPLEGRRLKPAPHGPTLDFLESTSRLVRTVTFAKQ